MAKDGQSRTLSSDEFHHLLDEIAKHRHPEKNTLIMQISFKLGLRVQEISLLRIKEVAEVGPEYSRGYRIKDTMKLPARFTKGARATNQASNKSYERKSFSFSKTDFNELVLEIAQKARDGVEVNPEDFYPKQRKNKGKARLLSLGNHSLRKALADYLDMRFAKNPQLKPSDTLIVSQKGGPYSPNTLQEHMAHMLRKWGQFDDTSSHSGRRTLATIMLHDQGDPLAGVQKVLGHKDAATTAIYHEIKDEELKRMVIQAGNYFDKKNGD